MLVQGDTNTVLDGTLAAKNVVQGKQSDPPPDRKNDQYLLTENERIPTDKTVMLPGISPA